MLLVAAEVALVAAIGIAVVRYRLYAIERLVNRTLVYVTLSLLLVGAYAAITLALGVVVAGGSDWVVALATLVVAVAFRPLRSRVQDLVDRRFSRARYEGVRRVRDFEDDVREGRREPEAIVLRARARRFATRSRRSSSGCPRARRMPTRPASLCELPDDGRARSEIEREGAHTAVLLHDPGLLEKPDLLRGVLAAAALSIEIARLRVEVRFQLAEVEASRARIVEAGYEERRRLERDLHDGAQQRLVSLGVQIRRLQRTLPDGRAVLSPALDQIVGRGRSRDRGLAPDRGRRAARAPRRRACRGASRSRELVARPVDVDARSGRVAASVEAAAYYVACEALTNAVKHASASKVARERRPRERRPLLTVSDDGVGGAVARRGSGLAGLEDRVAAHGGTLEIVSPSGEGTRIEVAIPCDS